MTAPLDPRDVGVQQIGTRLRDGAVNPADGDFLGPTNAGADGQLGNPHGPNVVSPEIHGSQGVRPVRAGAVSGTAATQSAAETGHLVEWVPSAATPEDDPDDPPGED